MSLTQALKGVGIMSYPIMIQFLMDKYGFFGTALIVAAIHANTLFGMIVLHPIEWHHKTIKIPIEEEELCKYSKFLLLYLLTHLHISNANS